MDIGSEGVVFGLVDLVTELEGDSRTVVGLDSEWVLGEGVTQVVAGVLPGEEGQELIVGCAHQMHCQSFSNQLQLMKLSPHWTESGLKKTLFAQAEAWPILSGSQQVPVCLLESVQTGGPAVSIK